MAVISGVSALNADTRAIVKVRRSWMVAASCSGSQVLGLMEALRTNTYVA